MKKNTMLKICIIGSGRLGLALAYAINNADSQEVSLASVSSRTDRSLSAAKKLLTDTYSGIFFTHDNFSAAEKANCIFVCTPDDEIEKTCREIFAVDESVNNVGTRDVFLNSEEKLDHGRRIKNPGEMTVIYFSGSKKINILGSAAKVGASVACMHPLKSFAYPVDTIKTLENLLYGVTYAKNDARARETIDILAALLKGRTIFVENDKKTLYHACASIASNYLVSLMDFALAAGLDAGLDPRIFLSGLISLSEGTLLNIGKLGTKKALTGPIARGDVSTISDHVEIIKSLNKEDIKEMYGIMGKKTAKIALENTWINDKTYNELLKILEK